MCPIKAIATRRLAMKEKFERDGPGSSSSFGENRKTLLRKYEIPVEHLDFRYLEKCNNVREIERILKVLRSGEEGHFPELEAFTAKKLEELNPRSRQLRVELPILRSEYLNSEEKKSLEKDFLEWTSNIDAARDQNSGEDGHQVTKQIFSESQRNVKDDGLVLLQDIFPVEQVPIRGCELINKQKERDSVSEMNKSLKATKDKPERIKSWEYDKWDKFDVDVELTKLDVGEMKREEWELSKQKKRELKEQQKLIEKLMRNEKAENIELLVPKKNANRLKTPTRSNVSICADGKSLTCDQKGQFQSSTSRGSGDFKVPELEAAAPEAWAEPKSRIPMAPRPSTSGARRVDGNIGFPTLGQRSSGLENSTNSEMSVKTQSFIEEIQDDEPVKPVKKKETLKKRFKIHIEDLNVG